MKIEAAVLLQQNTPLEVMELTLQEPMDGEVLVKLTASGVCHSDYHLISGATRHPLPAVLGHEGAGIVEAVGKGVTHIQPGDHIVLNWAPACGDCFYCLHDQPNLCETFTEPIWAGTMLNGTTRLYRDGAPVYHYCGLATFGQYAVVPQESCIAVRKDVPLEVAALVGCAVATGVGSVFYTAGVRPGQSVVVVGCGAVVVVVVTPCGEVTAEGTEGCADATARDSTRAASDRSVFIPAASNTTPLMDVYPPIGRPCVTGKAAHCVR